MARMEDVVTEEFDPSKEPRSTGPDRPRREFGRELSGKGRSERSPRGSGAGRAGGGKRPGAGPLGPSRVESERPSQISGEVRRALQAALLRGVNDPRVQGLVSVTEVTLSTDGSVATVRVSVVPEDRAPLTLSGLQAGAGFLRRRVMQETRIARVPRLVFEIDDRIKRQAALDAAVRAGSPAGDQTASQAEDAPDASEREARHSETARDEG